MKWVGIVALLAGLALFFLTDHLKFETNPSPSLGQVEKVEGEVMGKTYQTSFYEVLKAGTPLNPNHKIMTSFDSRALLNFGEKFWLKANSLIRIEKDKEQFIIHLLSGAIERETLGNALFFVDGEKVNQKEITKGGITELTQLPIDDVALTVDSPTKGPEALNKRQIYQTFKLHQRFIEKCFIKHYARQKGQTQSGKVWVIFNITKKGRLDSPKIDKSDYSDAQFHSCLKEVISRVRMKNYAGPTVQIKFPINIELPE